MFYEKFYKFLKQAVEAQAPEFMKRFYKLLKQARDYEKF